MSLLQKSAPALLYTGIAVVAAGAAVLSATFQPVADQAALARENENCEAIARGQQPAAALQHVGCMMRHGYHFGIR